jgi:light-regulated signal transduction histidine kinase (bacteriophytochrome)
MSSSEPKLSWPEVTRFIGQLNHDLRNQLNAVGLQTAFLEELVEEPEAKAEINRLREMTEEMCAQLRRLSATLGKVDLQTMPYPAVEFAEDLRTKLALQQSTQPMAVDWKISLGKEVLEVDPQLLPEAFMELFANAEIHQRGEGPLGFEIRAVDNTIEFSLREPKTQFSGATENWGKQPLQHLRSGHYGLGLFRSRSIFEAHHAHYRVHFDPAASVLSTTVSLPARFAS